METVYLGLGTNKGDGRVILSGACAALAKELIGLVSSSLYQSAPMYVTAQPPFLNAAVCGQYCGSPSQLLTLVNQIEARFGRDRTTEQFKGERFLDIDILLFGNRVVDDPPRLIIPHAGLLERKFALLPLLELNPFLSDPRSSASLAEICQSLAPQGIYYSEFPPYTVTGSH